jgi:3-oxoacyl-[acyl-carrier protein] reductase
MSSELKGKNAFITGAAGGLGIEIAKSLAKSGVNLFLTSGSNEEKLSGLKKHLKKKFKNQKFEAKIKGLLTEESNLEIAAHAQSLLGRIDILVNCAGIFPVGSIEDTSFNEFEKCFKLNVFSPFILSKFFARQMQRNKWGRIVNIGSSSAYSGFPNTAAYCASKHALLGMSRSFFHELKKDSVRTICISPGSIKSDMGKKVTGQDFETFIEPHELAATIVTLISLDGNMIMEEVRANRVFIQ